MYAIVYVVHVIIFHTYVGIYYNLHDYICFSKKLIALVIFMRSFLL